MKTRSLFWVLATIGLGVGLGIQWSARGSTRLLPFQGRLTDASGQVVSDGNRVVQFKLYNAPVGGQAVWNGEVQRLTVNGGIVSTLLGSKASLAGVDFNQDLYLELTLDANNDGQITLADPPLLPRQAVLPSVFAIEAANSRKLAGFDWSDLFGENSPKGWLLSSKIQEGSIDASKLKPESVTAAQLGDGVVGSRVVAKGSIQDQHLADQTVTAKKLAKDVMDLLVPPGTVVAFGGETIPDGWLLCDGQERPRSGATARLYEAIKTSWGSGNGTTTFNVPDLRGFFLRGVSGTSGRDPDRDLREGFPGGGRAGQVGSTQTNALQRHQHALGRNGADSFTMVPGGATQRLPHFLDDTFGAGPQKQTDLSGDSSETRPLNAYVHYIIKF